MKRRAPKCFSYERTIRSRLDEVHGLCLEVRKLLSTNEQNGANFGFELAVRECLNNAVLHGNLNNRQKHISFALRSGRKWLWVQITDEGPGFDWRRANRHPVADELGSNGRGLAIIRSYCAGVQFNRPGNRVTLKLRRSKRETDKP